MTYLFFMKMLDDAQKTKEANASIMGVTVKDPTFKEGLWHNPETDRDAEATRTPFLVPVAEIREKDYDLSINKYKEVEREVVVYDAPEVIMGRIGAMETEIQEALDKLRGELTPNS